MLKADHQDNVKKAEQKLISANSKAVLKNWKGFTVAQLKTYYSELLTQWAMAKAANQKLATVPPTPEPIEATPAKPAKPAKAEKTTRQVTATVNTIKKAIALTSHKKVGVNEFVIDMREGLALRFKFRAEGVLIILQGPEVKGTYKLTEQKNLIKVVGLIKAAEKYAATLISGKIEQQKEVVKKGNTAQPKKVQEAPKMTTSINAPKISQALMNAKWTISEDDILEHPQGTLVKFNEKSVRLYNPDKDVVVVVPTATTTDAQLVEYLKSIIAGSKPKMKKTKDLTAPVFTEDEQKFLDQRANLQAIKEKKEQAEKDAKAKAEKVEPVAPKNPNADGSSPIFDGLNTAIAETEKVEGILASTWQPIATQFKYSIKELTAGLHAEGKWPHKTNKKGEHVALEGELQPAGYKSVYDSEREAGVQGVGHMVNRASRMFAKYNPDLQNRTAKEDKGTAPVESSASEKTVETILMDMSKLAKKLPASDLQSWLETDPSVQPLWNELVNEQADSMGDLASEDTTGIDELGDLFA